MKLIGELKEGDDLFIYDIKSQSLMKSNVSKMGANIGFNYGNTFYGINSSFYNLYVSIRDYSIILTECNHNCITESIDISVKSLLGLGYELARLSKDGVALLTRKIKTSFSAKVAIDKMNMNDSIITNTEVLTGILCNYNDKVYTSSHTYESHLFSIIYDADLLIIKLENYIESLNENNLDIQKSILKFKSIKLEDKT